MDQKMLMYRRSTVSKHKSVEVVNELYPFDVKKCDFCEFFSFLKRQFIYKLYKQNIQLQNSMYLIIGYSFKKSFYFLDTVADL